MRCRAGAAQAMVLVAVMLLSSLLFPLYSADPNPDAPVMNDPVSGNAQVTLSWNAPHDYSYAIEGYIIYRGTSLGQESVHATVTGAATVTYTDVGLTNGQTYYYYVVAVNYHGPSAPSNRAVCTPYGPPGIPTGFTGVPGAGNITLSWTAPYDNGGMPVTHYRIYRGTVSGGLIFLATSEQTTYVDTGLSEGRTFYYRVSAVSGLPLEGTPSAEIKVVMTDVPGPVTTLVATPGNGSITLGWTAPADIGGSPLTGYQVYRGTRTGSQTFLSNSPTTTFIDSSLVNGQVYFYKVTASNSAGPGPYSNEVSATPLSLPSTPVSLQAFKGNQGAILSWSAPTVSGGTPITEYRIYRGTTAGAEIFLNKTTALNYTDVSLTNGKTYFYKVSAVNSLGEGPKSAAVSVIPQTVPGSPGGLSARGDLFKIVLTWTAPASTGGSNITGYNIYRGDRPGSEVFLMTLGNVLTFTDAGLSADTTRYYYITALNGAGEGAPSIVVHARTFGTPSMPLALAALPGNATILLTWKPPADNGRASVDEYVIYRGTTPGAGERLAIVKGLSYLDQELTNGQIYYYRVSAVNAVGEGAKSMEISSTPALPPTEPIWLVASPSSQKVILSWIAPISDGGSPVTSYEIYRSAPPGNSTSLLTSVTSTSYTDTGLVNGEAYYYQVLARNAAGPGPLSPKVSAIPAHPPGAPTDLKAVGGLRQVALTWTAPADDGGSAISGYNVYRGTSPGGEGEVPVAMSVRSPFTDTGLEDSTTYYYKVSAVNPIGVGPRSAEVAVTTLYVPAPPAQLVATAGDGTVALKWNASSSGDGSPLTYRLYRGTMPGLETYLATVSSTSYDDAGLINGLTYSYRVTAVNATGEGKASDRVSATPCTLPSAPLNLTAEAGNGRVIVQWNPPYDDGGCDVIGYRLYWSNSPSEGFRALDVSGNAKYHDGLTNGLPYYYKVAAVNQAGEGPVSGTVLATPQAKPGPPSGLKAVGGDGKVTLTWSEPLESTISGIQGYRVYRGNSSLDLAFYDITPTTSFTDTQVANGRTYYYSVSAVNATGEGPTSNVASATPSEQPQDLMSILGRYWMEILIIVIAVLVVVGTIFIMVGSGMLSLGKEPKE